MFVLYDIAPLEDDLANLPETSTVHRLTFKAVYTIKDVPDSFTGIIFEDSEGVLNLQHFNNPKGNVRKIITLKNKLPEGMFGVIKERLFARAQGQLMNYPEEIKVPESD